jgi:hypothetical protein
MGANETHAFTGYADAAGWERLQMRGYGRPPAGVAAGPWASLKDAQVRRARLIEAEHVRLLRSSAPRPKPVTPPEDRRAVYGMRRFSIHPKDWPAFVRHSNDGIWPRIEAQDACILGLFRDLVDTDPLEVTLLTGYHGPSHWEATRDRMPKPADMPQELWDRSQGALAARTAITLRSHVCLMTAHWPRA